MLSTALTQEERAARMKAALEQVLKPPRPLENSPGGERVKASPKARPDALTPPAKDRDRSRR